jgi:hypothetical protein
MRKNQSLQTTEFEPTEEIEPVIENLNNIESFPAGRHIWRQQGPYIVCSGCPLSHAIYIGMEKIMVGEDEKGEPILKSRQELFGNH